jgi:PmbA protein
MDSDSLIDTVLSKVRGAADAAEVYYEDSESRPVEFENNKVKYVATKSGRGVGLRVIHRGRIGFSSTSDFGRIDELVQNALESASFGEKARFELPERCEAPEVAVLDDRVADLSAAQMAELGQSAIDVILQRHPDVQCSGSVTAGTSRERVANSAGLDVGHRSTTFSIHLSALAVEEGNFLWVGDGRRAANLLADPAPIVEKIVGDLDLAQRPAALSTGSYPAVFTPDAMGTLLLSLSQGVNGKLVQKGASPLAGQVGKTILDERITVIDDALVDYGSASAPHDTEGLAARRTTLVEHGVLKNYLFDLQTAGILGAAPTANGLRSYGSQPSPGHNNTMVQPGDTPSAEMIGGIRKGLLVDSVLGGGMSNTLAGEFSVNVELGFLIEDGRAVGRVKNCMIFGNVYDLLKNGIEAIGDTPEMKGSLSVPHVCVKDLSVGAQ